MPTEDSKSKPIPEAHRKLLAKYPEEKLNAVRKRFERDLQRWNPVQTEQIEDMKCISTERGPWPDAEWNSRHAQGQERPCLHEDVISQYHNQVINQIEMNPLGVEVQPEGDGADEKTAEDRENRLRAIEYQQSGSQTYLQAVGDAIRGSYGFWKLETAAGPGGTQYVLIESITDPNSIIPGFWKKPDACDLQDAWELDVMTKEEFVERWPWATRTDWDSFRNVEGVAPRWVRDDGTVQVCAWWHFDDTERELLEIDTPEGSTRVYADEFKNGIKAFEGKIKTRRTEKKRKVLKTIFNGIEALDETEWPDPGDEIYGPEIPIFIVTGRQKFEKGVRQIDSLTRKARIGQLLYDYTISQIQEVMALAPRTARLGPEGTFDTSTNWHPRSITATKEYKPTVNPENGQTNPPPILEQYDVSGLQFLEMTKNSILIGIQNAIGMSSTERKDRTAKSAKALDVLNADMNVATAHYFNALRITQERSYRVINRVDEYLTNQTGGTVSLRDRFGKHTIKEVGEGYFKGRHAIVIGSGKLYQSQQEEQADFATELTKIGATDPDIMLAALYGATKMKGLGEYGDKLSDVWIALLSSRNPQAAAALRGEKQPIIPPEVQAAMQQSQQAIQALNEQAHEYERRIIELEDERNAKILDLQTRKDIADADNETKIAIAEIQAAAKIDIGAITAQLDQIRMAQEVLTQSMGQQHEAEQAGANREHEATESELSRQHEGEQSEADRQLAQQQAAQAAQESTNV